MGHHIERTRSTGRAMLLTVPVIVIWSTAAVVEAAGVRTVPPLLFSLWSTFFGSLALLAVLAARGETGHLFSFRPADHAMFVVLSLLGFTGYQVMKYTAFTISPVLQVNILHYTYPVFTVLFAAPLLHHRLTPLKLAGVASGFAGVAVILSEGRMVAPDPAFMDGYLLALGAGMSFGLFSALASKLDYKPMPSMFYIQIWNTLILLAATTATGCFAAPSTHTQYAGILYSGVFSNVVGILLLVEAQKVTRDISLIAGSLFTIPFLSMIPFRIFLDVPIPFHASVGLTLIVGGMMAQTLLTRHGEKTRKSRGKPVPPL